MELTLLGISFYIFGCMIVQGWVCMIVQGSKKWCPQMIAVCLARIGDNQQHASGL